MISAAKEIGKGGGGGGGEGGVGVGEEGVRKAAVASTEGQT